MNQPVIPAHSSLPNFGALDFGYQDDKEDFFKLFAEMPERNWKLFFCFINKRLKPYSKDQGI